MQKPHIIVHLDDDDDDRDLLREAMEASDKYRLVPFKAASELFPYLKEYYRSICLIVLDINLLLSNGVCILEEIKKNHEYESIPIVMLTTGGNSPQIKAIQTYGVKVITKPMAFSELKEIADQLLAICLEHPEVE